MCALEPGSSIEEAAKEAFRGCKLWSAASVEERAELWCSTRIRQCSRGEILFHEGVDKDEFALVVDGHLRGVHVSQDGRMLGIRSAWPGELMGSYLAVAGGAYVDNIVAEEPSLVCLVKTVAFRKLLESNPSVAMAMLEYYGALIGELIAAVHTLAADVTARVAAYILDCAGRERLADTGPFEVDLKVSRVELASALGTAPETLSRTFAQLASEHVISSSGGQIITVLDAATLVALAENR